MVSNMSKYEYPFAYSPLSKEDGGGWLVTYPDLPGCMSGGDSPEQALKHTKDALMSWFAANKAENRPIPEPNSASGKFLVRMPKSLHSRLIARATAEGVSLNCLVQTCLAERV